MIKKIFPLLFLLTVTFLLAAQENNSEFSWKILEQAQVEFDSGNYGESLNLCNRAKNVRAEEISYEYDTLEKAVAPRQVVRAGSNFRDVIPVLQEREQKAALEIISKYTRIYGAEFFENSVHNLISWLKKRTVYPEADFLLGKIYQVEGEFEMAERFYEEARKNSDLLDIPSVQYEILYSMAYLARERNDSSQMEKLFILILDNDENYRNENLKNALIRTIDSDRESDVDRFFMLYRAENNFSVKALFEMASIQKMHGRGLDSIKCTALGTVESFTHIYEILVERNPEYRYTTFKDFLNQSSLYEDIFLWGRENSVWELFYSLAEKSSERGKLLFARKLYTDMAESMPDPYFKALAKSRISESGSQ